MGRHRVLPSAGDDDLLPGFKTRAHQQSEFVDNQEEAAESVRQAAIFCEQGWISLSRHATSQTAGHQKDRPAARK